MNDTYVTKKIIDESKKFVDYFDYFGFYMLCRTTSLISGRACSLPKKLLSLLRSGAKPDIIGLELLINGGCPRRRGACTLPDIVCWLKEHEGEKIIIKRCKRYGLSYITVRADDSLSNEPAKRPRRGVGMGGRHD